MVPIVSKAALRKQRRFALAFKRGMASLSGPPGLWQPCDPIGCPDEEYSNIASNVGDDITLPPPAPPLELTMPGAFAANDLEQFRLRLYHGDYTGEVFTDNDRSSAGFCCLCGVCRRHCRCALT